MTALDLTQAGAIGDLATFAQRVAAYEAEAVVRIVASGSVAGCFAETPFDALALRAIALAEPVELDVVVEASTLAARAAGAGSGTTLELPPSLPALRWTTSLPPRTGWSELTRIELGKVSARVDEGVAEFQARAPSVTEDKSLRAARAALEGLATEIWDAELAAGVPLRLAHAASSYGFLVGADKETGAEVVLRSAGSWWRLDAPHGAVVARGGLALFAL